MLIMQRSKSGTLAETRIRYEFVQAQPDLYDRNWQWADWAFIGALFGISVVAWWWTR